MCQDIQQVSFYCGHQAKYWWGRSRFCLFAAGAGAEAAFHTTYIRFEQSNDICPKCITTKEVRSRGLVLPRGDFQKLVALEYKKTSDWYQETQAAKYVSDSQDTLSKLSKEDIAGLELQIRQNVAANLAKESFRAGSKVVLLRHLTMLPEVFDKKELVLFFASRYFENNKSRKLEGEYRKLSDIVRKARLERTFKTGFNMREPLPIGAPKAASPEVEEVGQALGDVKISN
ncbi:hypothetical protein F4808DRAFT_463374 [Astrocystis sublimbata]|nr:hypothetical protein F4808DRAFT_463374 [Astrocystis sublimbata]